MEVQEQNSHLCDHTSQPGVFKVLNADKTQSKVFPLGFFLTVPECVYHVNTTPLCVQTKPTTETRELHANTSLLTWPDREVGQRKT